MNVYVIGSLRNPEVTKIANILREDGHDVFDDWMAAGPEADDYWMKYEKERGHDLATALQGFAAQHVFHFDKHHLDAADAVVLVMPAGKSGHLELGYSIGKGKRGYILLDKEPERFDVMYAFAAGIYTKLDQLREVLRANTTT